MKDGPTQELRRAFERAVAGFDLGKRVRDALARRPRPHVLAVGKAAARMLGGALDRSVRDALLVVPDGAPLGWVGPTTKVIFSDHPLPTARSLRAAEEALAYVGRGDVCALVSGGASALLAAPVAGLSLDDKADIVRRLLHGGATIREINVVRRHLSRIKGGGLARACAGRIVTLVASDVIGGAPVDVGSGPTIPDPTTVEEARAVMDRFGLRAPLVETLKPHDAEASKLEHVLVATPDDFARAVGAELERDGFAVFDLPATEDDARDLARAYSGLAATLNPGQALVRAAEPRVEVDVVAPGRGGRCAHVAALAGPHLPEGVALLCGASDGLDGSGGAAGAVVTRAALRNFDVAAAVRRFDTAKLHDNAGTSIPSQGPSGINFCDVHVIARAPRP